MSKQQQEPTVVEYYVRDGMGWWTLDAKQEAIRQVWIDRMRQVLVNDRAAVIRTLVGAGMAGRAAENVVDDVTMGFLENGPAAFPE
jgi:hypothetical protein